MLNMMSTGDVWLNMMSTGDDIMFNIVRQQEMTGNVKHDVNKRCLTMLKMMIFHHLFNLLNHLKPSPFDYGYSG